MKFLGKIKRDWFLKILMNKIMEKFDVKMLPFILQIEFKIKMLEKNSSTRVSKHCVEKCSKKNH